VSSSIKLFRDVSCRKTTQLLPFKPCAEKSIVKKVGMTGFEPAASCSQSRRATKLRYIPYIIQDTANGADVAIILTKRKTQERDDRPLSPRTADRCKPRPVIRMSSSPSQCTAPEIRSCCANWSASALMGAIPK
jgi:hypothetical protein